MFSGGGGGQSPSPIPPVRPSRLVCPSLGREGAKTPSPRVEKTDQQFSSICPGNAPKIGKNDTKGKQQLMYVLKFSP